MSKEAMKKALDALVGWKEYMPALFDEDDEKAITALREALAEQRTWVGLTDEEIEDAGRFSYCRGGTSEKLYHIMWNSQPSASIGWCRDELISFTKAIEAKLKEKNT